MPSEMTSRREFAVAAAGLTALADQIVAQTSGASTGVPTRVLGRTGQRVSMICLGGWHIGSVKDDNESIRIMHAAIDEGLTFFDNAWDYHGGHSEEIMGKALEQDGKRKKVFLMTKNCERDYDGSMKCLEESLKRLRTDHIDLWQFHEMVYDNDPDWVFEKGGLKAALEAKKQGKVRFIGFTGHKDPRIHLKMLSKPHDWDTAQMPINAADYFFRSFQREVVPVCLKKNVGVIGMKGFGGGSSQGRLIEKLGLTVEDMLRYNLSQPVSTQVVGINTMEQLKLDIKIAREFKPMSADEKNTFLSKVKDEATDGRHELFKTTLTYDGPHHRKQHGFAIG